MTQPAKTLSHKLQSGWQEKFVAMLPAIQEHAAYRFRHRLPEEREDLVAETVALACVMFARLVEGGKVEPVFQSDQSRDLGAADYMDRDNPELSGAFTEQQYNRLTPRGKWLDRNTAWENYIPPPQHVSKRRFDRRKLRSKQYGLVETIKGRENSLQVRNPD